MKKINVNINVFGILILATVILLFLTIRGCGIANKRQETANQLQLSLNNMAKKNEVDRLQSIEREQQYKDSLQFRDGELALQILKREATEERLLSTTNNVAFWKQKYQSVKPDNDTSVTLVPNEFITDAHDCFDEVESKNRLIKLYVQEVKDVDSAHREKEKLQENRIGQLKGERDSARSHAAFVINLAKDIKDNLKPRGILYLKLATIAIDRYYPSGVGAGILYKDKRNRLYGVKAFGTNVGPIYEAEIGLPLSFKRK